MSDEYWRDQWRISEKRSNDFETKLKIAVEALKFYANEEVYEQKEGSPWETPDGNLQRGYYTEISDHDNNGDRARVTLAKIAITQQAGSEKK